MSIKRIEFPNAPSGSVGAHQRSMLAMGLDAGAITPPPPVSDFTVVKSHTGMSWKKNGQFGYIPINRYRAYRIIINNLMWYEFNKKS